MSDTCDELSGRMRDICRGHDTDGLPVKLRHGSREKYLALWGITPEERKELDAGSPKIEIPVGGPGTELKAVFAAKGFPSCHQCNALARRMDLWGVDGCRERLDEIMAEILPRARLWLKQERPWAQALLGTVGIEDAVLSREIRKRVLAAIEAAEGVQNVQR